MMKQLKITTSLNKNEKYILTCSYGPDSMALFRYLLDENFDFEVAHVNYHILDQANEDCKKIVDFCAKFNKKLHILSIHMPPSVNEEEWARDVRYSWFDHLSKTTGIKNVLVAHNKNDSLETFVMQKEKGVHLYYGIKEKMERKDSIILRPLLPYFKSELEEFCRSTNTDFSIDPSNFDTKFRRNKIRKELSEQNNEFLKNLDAEMSKLNEENQNIIQKYKSFVDEIYGFDFFKALEAGLDEKEFQIVLLYLISKLKIDCEIGTGRNKEIFHKASTFKGVSKDYLAEDFYLYFEYGFLKIDSPHIPYKFEVDGETKNEFFEIDIRKIDLLKAPHTKKIFVKNCTSAAFFDKNGVKTPINRALSKMKVPLSLRDIWPAIFDDRGRIIYIPRFQKNFKEKGILTPNIKNLEKLTRVNCKKDIFEL